MNNRRWIAAAIFAAASFAAACAAGPATAAPIEAYAQQPAIDHVTVSPDGGKVAYILHSPSGDAVLAVGLNPARQLLGMNYGQQKLQSLTWADPTHLLVTRAAPKPTGPSFGPPLDLSLLDSIDLATQKSTRLLDSPPADTLKAITGYPEVRTVDGHVKVFVRGYVSRDSIPVATLLVIDLGSLDVSRVHFAGDNAARWVVDPAGFVVAETRPDTAGHGWRLWLGADNNSAKTPGAAVLAAPPTVAGLSPDGSSIILGVLDNGHFAWRPAALKGGALGAPIEAWQDLTQLIVDPATGRVIGGQKAGTTAQYVFFAPADQASWDAVVRLFPDEAVEFVAFSRNRGQEVVRVTGQAHGIPYILVDNTSHSSTEIGQAYAGLKPDDLAGVVTIEYHAADGTKIPAYLTLPNVKDAKNLPLVVLPHAGPGAADSPGYDWWSQALAARGYAVLQPQYRGSTGSGPDLMAAGFGQWGRKIQSDLSDGVRGLAKAGMIDPKRVCIVGADYGGYAALAGVAFESGVYRCAVSVGGMSDPGRLLAWARRQPGGQFNPNVGQWSLYLGAKDANDPIPDALAPVKAADKVPVPVLLIHVKDDAVSPLDQSQKMADALTAAGKSVQLVTLPGDDHALATPDTRIQMLQATVKFLEANNPPG